MKNIEQSKLNKQDMIAFGGVGDSNLSTFSGSSSCIPNANATACQPISSPACDALATYISYVPKLVGNVPVVTTYVNTFANYAGAACTTGVNNYNNLVNASSLAIFRNNY